jgi:cell wall assembly regulator SMI1
MQDVVERLGQWWWQNFPKKLEGLKPAATDEEIAATEKALGVTFPEGLRALYRWRGGPADDGDASLFGNFSMMRLDQIVSTHKMMNELADRGDFKGTSWWRKTWVPILDRGNGDNIVWDPKGAFSGEPGQVLEFVHDYARREILAPSFDAYLTAFVESLEAGNIWQLDTDGGYLLDDDLQFHDFLAKRFKGYPIVAVDGAGKRGKKATKAPPPIAADPSRPVKPYNVNTRFEVADQVEHPKFGLGVVQSVEEAKCTIRFSDGERGLVHGRGSGAALGKPPRVDHTTGPRKV